MAIAFAGGSGSQGWLTAIVNASTPQSLSIMYYTRMAENFPADWLTTHCAKRCGSRTRQKPGALNADWLREISLVAGADDVAVASVDNPDLASRSSTLSRPPTSRACPSAPSPRM